jgi:hypothetical protein
VLKDARRAGRFVAREACSRFKGRNMKLGFDAIYNDDIFYIHHHPTIEKIYWIMREVSQLTALSKYKNAIKYMLTDYCNDNRIIL